MTCTLCQALFALHNAFETPILAVMHINRLFLLFLISFVTLFTSCWALGWFPIWGCYE